MGRSTQEYYGLVNTDAKWMREGSCRTPAGQRVDFTSLRKRDIAAAKTVCSGCPVKEECLSYAVENNLTHFVFGGVQMPAVGRF